MGYECPVCGIPQADGEHLANHIAFTALIHNDEHEAWLDEHAPGWEDVGEDELADTLIETAVETEFPQVFEDTTAGSTEHDHDHERSGQLFDEPLVERQGREQRVGSALDAEAQAVLEEARRMTETETDTEDDEA